MEHVPLLTRVTVVPPATQTAVVGDVKMTGRPELAVALTVNGAAPKFFPVKDPNVMVCDPMLTLKLTVTDGAGM